MSRTTTIRTGAVIAAAAVALPLSFLLAASPATAAEMATVSVLHAIPAGNGADVVDVYAGNALLIDNFTPGTLKTVMVPAGTYTLGVYADNKKPGTDTAVLEAKDVVIPAGANASVTANLTADDKPALNVFVNDISKTKPGEARLTVRHVAGAPAVDVRANGKVLVPGLVNPKEAVANVPAGKYSADVVLAGTTTVAIGPADLTLAEGTNTIVYAWGSAAGNSLKLATQTITGLHSSPAGVPAGGGSTAPATPAWALGLLAAGAVLAGGAGVRMATTRRGR